MTWRQLLLVSCFSVTVLLSMLQEGTSASVGTRQVARQEAQEGVEQKIFMQESDASNFLKKRGKRSPKSRDEVHAENIQKLRADELRREYHEEQRNESENFVEEQNDGPDQSIDGDHNPERTHLESCQLTVTMRSSPRTSPKIFTLKSLRTEDPVYSPSWEHSRTRREKPGGY